MVFGITGIRRKLSVKACESCNVIIDALRQKTGSRYHFECKIFHQCLKSGSFEGFL